MIRQHGHKSSRISHSCTSLISTHLHRRIALAQTADEVIGILPQIATVAMAVEEADHRAVRHADTSAVVLGRMTAADSPSMWRQKSTS